MTLEEQYHDALRTLMKHLPDLQRENFPDDAIVKEIHRLFPEALVIVTESPAVPRPGVTSTVQYGVNWHGFTFTVTRKIF